MNRLMKKIRRMRRRRKARYIVKEFRNIAAVAGVDLTGKSDFQVLLIAARFSKWSAMVVKAMGVTMQQLCDAFAELAKAMIEVAEKPGG